MADGSLKKRLKVNPLELQTAHTQTYTHTHYWWQPGVLTFLGGGRRCAGALTRPSTRHLLPKNFEKTALRKRVGIFSVKTEITVHK